MVLQVSQPLHPGGEKYPSEGGGNNEVSPEALKSEFFSSLGLDENEP